MLPEILSEEALRKERQKLKELLIGYRYGRINGRPLPEFVEMEKRFQEVSDLLRPKAKS